MESFFHISAKTAPAATAGIIFFALLFIYHRYSRKKWKRLIAEAVEYHRHHLTLLRGSYSQEDRSGEMSRAMLWAINKQYPRDMNSGGGRMLWRTFTGRMTSIQIVWEVYYRASRYGYQTDERIIRLMATLLSTLYRSYFLNSALSLPAVVFMDIRLMSSRLRKTESGPAALYRDLASRAESN